MPSHGDLRVWWIPQIPMSPFYVPVWTSLEARKILDTLAYYDAFQLENNIKPDYCNDGGLQVFDSTDKEDDPDGSWIEWETDKGEDIGDFDILQLRLADPKALPQWYGCDQVYIDRDERS